MEPEQLSAGKLFHKIIQSEWAGYLEGGKVNPEFSISFFPDLKLSNHTRKGRIDIFVDKINDFVSVFEIKSTNWDNIKRENRKKLIGSHRRQVLKYVDKYLASDQMNVCAAIIYPSAPVSDGLREWVEEELNEYGLAVMWYA